jgi:glycosyltransferase involved in cell wall biosynthesis
MAQKILIIIPGYNEAASLPIVLSELRLVEGYDITPIVINDCSTDGTAIIARQNGVKLLDLAINLGIGGAMQTGYLYALKNNYDLAIQVDGDGQHLPSELYKLIDHYNQNAVNVVIGSRFLTKNTYRSTMSRRVGIYYFHLLNKLFAHKNIYDCTSGFRLFDRKAIEIAAASYPDEYPEPESLILFTKCGLTIAEVPVIMRARLGGTSSIRHFNSFYYMVKVTIAMFFSYLRYFKK